jgi:hypothetical protein
MVVDNDGEVVEARFYRNAARLEEYRERKRREEVVGEMAGQAASGQGGGYMVKRGEFEEEYDKDAEELLADMDYRHDEEDSFKDQVINIYN